VRERERERLPIIKINLMSCTDKFSATRKLRERQREKKREREKEREREREREREKKEREHGQNGELGH
jgi:hypothetical protein